MAMTAVLGGFRQGTLLAFAMRVPGMGPLEQFALMLFDAGWGAEEPKAGPAEV